MAGVPGAGGPIPKRSDQRRNKTKPAITEIKAAGATSVEVPAADPEWHFVARNWFDSLAKSGQSAFYEPSDWATAYLVAESISRELREQPVVSGAALSAWLKAMTALMVTEGDRRRARIELERPKVEGGEEVAGVSELDIYRRRLNGAS